MQVTQEIHMQHTNTIEISHQIKKKKSPPWVSEVLNSTPL